MRFSVALDLGDQQQVRDAFRAGVDVDVGGQHGHENGVGTAHQLGHLVRGNCGRGIHDDALRIAGGTQVEAARGAVVELVSGDAVNRRLLDAALLEPAHGGALRIEVHQHRSQPVHGVIAGEVDGDGRLTRSAFGVEDDDALHGKQVCAGARCAPRSLRSHRTWRKQSLTPISDSRWPVMVLTPAKCGARLYCARHFRRRVVSNGSSASGLG